MNRKRSRSAGEIAGFLGAIGLAGLLESCLATTVFLGEAFLETAFLAGALLAATFLGVVFFLTADFLDDVFLVTDATALPPARDFLRATLAFGVAWVAAFLTDFFLAAFLTAVFFLAEALFFLDTGFARPPAFFEATFFVEPVFFVLVFLRLVFFGLKASSHQLRGYTVNVSQRPNPRQSEFSYFMVNAIAS